MMNKNVILMTLSSWRFVLFDDEKGQDEDNYFLYTVNIITKIKKELQNFKYLHVHLCLWSEKITDTRKTKIFLR